MKRSRRFPEAPASVPGARQFVADRCRPWSPEVCDTAALLVSELATNAVVHAASDFEVTVVYPTPSGRVRIEVVDSDPGRPAPCSRLRPPLMDGAFSSSPPWPRVGGRRAARRAGKTVWFELAPPGGRGGRRGEAPERRCPALRPRPAQLLVFALHR